VCEGLDVAPRGPGGISRLAVDDRRRQGGLAEREVDVDERIPG
jgi:hypothetical protein